MIKRYRTVCGLVMATTVLGGCSSGGPKASQSPPKSKARSSDVPAPDGSKPIVVSPQIVSQFESPLAATALRERALDMLGSMASDPAPQVRANSMEAMARTPTRLRPYVVAGLRDENVGVRSTAAMMVGRAGLCDVGPALRPLLTDPSPYVRASSIYSLAKCKAEVDRTPLAVILLTDPNPRVRAHVAFLLGELGDPSALGLIHDAAKAQLPMASSSEYRMMQIQCAEAMVKLGEQDQIATIRAALYPSRPEDLEVSALAVQVLAELRDRGSIDELIYLSARKDESGHQYPAEVRLGVAGALARMGLKQGTFIADEYAASTIAPLRAQAVFVYGEIGRPEDLARLDILLNVPVGIVRVAAAAAVVKTTSGPATRASAQ